ncbi:CBS domain-containing protein [Alteromonas facilis]|uniref:CBS domain-containing protein n=1 Tax=Alteromonas facilis TaxID=2048004 RepID=UPI000C285AD1|nr:CBS domain-containing protein [Alteromonas facilis]
MSQFKITKCSEVTGFCWPEDKTYLTLRSPAKALLTDFDIQRPLVIDANTKAVEAAYVMKKAHVRLRFVVDRQLQFAGIIDGADLSQQNIIQRVADGYDRHELKVSDFMRKKSELLSITFGELQRSSINRLLGSFKTHEDPFILVTTDDHKKIKGIVTLHDLSRHFHLPDGMAEPSTFRGWLEHLTGLEDRQNNQEQKISA